MEIIGAGLAFVVALATGGLAVTLGHRKGLLDTPDDDLKSHSRPAVPLGGAAFLLSVQTGLAAMGVVDTGFLVASGLLWVMGFVDDVRGLSPNLRLAGGILGGVILAVFSGPASGLIAASIVVVAVVVTVNAVNLLDGMDALTGVTTSVAFLGLALYGYVQHSGASAVALVPIGGLVGFLFWNRPQARLFLGDNGAYVVGVTLVWTALQVGAGDGADLVAIALVGVPLLDLGATIARRLVSRSPLFSGDRSHTYDLLREGGLPIWRVVGLYAIAQATWAAILILVSGNATGTMAALSAVILGAVIVFVTVLALGGRPIRP